MAFAKSAFEMLSGHDTRAIQLLHFQRTMVSLGIAKFPRVPTLWYLIEELADLRDSRDGQAPYGLVEFLARLASDAALGYACRRDIADWLAKYGKDRQREAEDRILADRSTRLLLFEVKHVDGRLAELLSYVRFEDLTPVPGFNVKTNPVANWDGLCQAVRSRIDDCQVSGQHVDLHLHFLTDAPLFGRAFHKIQGTDGMPLGELHLCTVHSLRRALLPDSHPELERWRRWIEALRCGAFADVAWQPVRPNPITNGLCYADFPLLPEPMGTASKLQIRRLIMLGAPVLCWPHDEEPGPALAEELQAMAQEAGGVDQLPRVLNGRRVSEHPVGADLSMLLDDWSFRPFMTTRGAG
jgi:hypothetical protein